jgi:hypothetical protein
MHRKKLLRVSPKWIFTTNQNASQKVKLAYGIILNLRDSKDGEHIDYKKEGQRLAVVLRLIFPKNTLAALKRCLPDNN